MDYEEESESELSTLEDHWEEEYESELSTSEVDWGGKESEDESGYGSEPWSDNANSEAELEYDDELSSKDVYENKSDYGEGLGDEETDSEVILQELVEHDEEQSSCMGYGSDKTWLEENDHEGVLRSEMSSPRTDLQGEDHGEGSWYDESEIDYGKELEYAHDNGEYYQAEEEESWGYSTNDEQEPRYIHYSGHGQGPEAYLCWEKNMEDWFSSNQIPEEEKTTIAEETLTEDAWAYWEQDSSLRLEYGIDEATWEEMKQILSDEFVRDQDDNRQHYTRTHANPNPTRWIEVVNPSPKELPKHAYHSHESKKNSINALEKQQGLQLTAQEEEVQRVPSALPLFELQIKQDTRPMEVTTLLMRDVQRRPNLNIVVTKLMEEQPLDSIQRLQSIMPKLEESVTRVHESVYNTFTLKEEPPDLALSQHVFFYMGGSLTKNLDRIWLATATTRRLSWKLIPPTPTVTRNAPSTYQLKEEPPDFSLPFKNADKTTNHAYRFELQGKVGISFIYLVSDLDLLGVGDVAVLRSKPLEEGGNDEGIEAPDAKYQLPLFEKPQGAITSNRAKALKDKISMFVQACLDGEDSEPGDAELEIAWMIAWLL